MAVGLLPIGNDAPYMGSDGSPLSGGKIYFYVAGSSTPQDTFTTSSGGTANDNPVVLNSAGYPEKGASIVQIWGTEGVSYKAVGKTSADVTLWTRDNLEVVNDVSATADQWVSGAAPTYVSATSFTLVGDQTSTYHAGRRLKSTNTAGTIYSTIVSATFGAVTTIVVVNDSGTLDSGLSAISYGLDSATNPSTPLLTDAYPIVSGSADKTKKLRIEVDGFTTATTRVLTPPNYDGTIATLDGTETFTAKTLTAPTLTTPALGTIASGVLSAGTTATQTAGDNSTKLASTAYADRLGITIGTEWASTSGTENDWPIPSGTKRAKVMFVGVSTNSGGADDDYLIQLQDAGGLKVTGYLGSSSSITGATTASRNATTGFVIGSTDSQGAGGILHGTLVLDLERASTFMWVASGTLGDSAAARNFVTAGRLALTGELTSVRVTTVSGNNTFDAGVINVITEQ